MSNVWNTLSRIDVGDKVERKGNLSYLSWAWAWGKTKELYPEAKYEVRDNVVYGDGTVEVWVTVQIEDVVHSMWLPVMDHRNNAIANPDSRKISDARMRCLTKCLAMFGLGHYIYAGEDLPLSSTAMYEEERAQFDLQPTDYMFNYMQQSEERQIEIANCAPQGKKTEWKVMLREGEAEIHAHASSLAAAIEDIVTNGSDSELEEAINELVEMEKRLVWARLSEGAKKYIKESRERS